MLSNTSLRDRPASGRFLLDPFTIEALEEALGDGVVVPVPESSHAAYDAVRFQECLPLAQKAWTVAFWAVSAEQWQFGLTHGGRWSRQLGSILVSVATLAGGFYEALLLGGSKRFEVAFEQIKNACP